MLGYLSRPPVIYTRYSSMTLDFVCNTCNKSVSSRNSIECNLCRTQTHFKCNNLNFVDGQVIKNANKSWFGMFGTCLVLNPPENLTNLF